MAKADPIFLTIEDVLQIHETLVAEFSKCGDPISPPGVKNIGLLESAVGRQWTGNGLTLKYPDPISNAATLLYGICCDHPFHNGNKRTALVCMLAHLEKNKLTVFDTSQDELYSLMIRVADHSIAIKQDPRRKRPATRPSPDKEVEAIDDWIRRRASKVTRGERQITYKELRRILESFDYSLKNPKKNLIDIIRYEKTTKGLFHKRTETIEKHIGAIDFPGDNLFVSMKVLKLTRKICKLTEEDGVDSTAFYDEAAVVDSFVNRYRTILRKLART